MQVKKNLLQNSNVLLSCLIIALALVIHFVVIPAQTSSHLTRVGMGARTFPRFILNSIIVFSLIQGILAVICNPEDIKNDVEKIQLRELIVIAPVLLLLTVCVLLMSRVGFYVTFGAGLFVLQWILGGRNIVYMTVACVSFVLITYLVLEMGLSMILPRGILF